MGTPVSAPFPAASQHHDRAGISEPSIGQARHMKIDSTFWLSLGSLADVSNKSMLGASANFRAKLEKNFDLFPQVTLVAHKHFRD